MSALYTLDSVYSNVRVARYANGQRLAADDLRADQQAALVRAQRVGRAAGWGVVEGLIVAPAETKTSKSAQAVTISEGLALNRLGDPVVLDLPAHTLNLTSVRLVTSEPSSATPAPLAFDDCGQVVGSRPASSQADRTRFDDCPPITGPTGPVTPPAPPTTLADGVYVLAVRPVTRDVATPTDDLDGGLGSCAARWQESGVEFRVILLEKILLPSPIQKQTETPNRFRSRVAAWCFMDSLHAATLSDPFRPRPFAELAHLDATGLEKADVPLAVLLWKNQAVVWVDNWPVRRRVVQPNPAREWKLLTSDSAAAQGEARFYQFQEQLRSIDFDAKPTILDLFHWLPPVAYLPVRLSDPARPDPVEGRRETFERAVFTQTMSLLKTHATARWKLTEKEAAEMIHLATATQAIERKIMKQETNHLIDLESFFKSYTDTFGEAILKGTFIDQHQAIRLLHSAWHDSAIDLDAGEPIRVCLVIDTLLVWERLKQLLHRLSADQPDARWAGAVTEAEYWELQERWQRSTLRRKLARQPFEEAPTTSEQIVVEPARIEPLYAVVTRQELAIPEQTIKPRD